ncbi:leucine-rich repeat serine/threonine-protein kinase 1 [Cimex lectularius]|uniref:non-specific serine/threonine protein kinase n=1 Tax=Cimex lectularius TaxID=79782 RepID=A0A8I6RSP9_CIMLE|nr:leucine-rich repeat serine/threonine-protein kinase 1 [Cimex lectularius]
MDVMTPDDDEFNERLLHQSALWDNAELLEDLLRGDQLNNMNSQDSWGRTPLHAAATTESSTCLRVLLQAGADPNIPCGPRGENKTPLHVCAEHGFVNNIQLLVQHGADLMAKEANGLTALDLAEKSEQIECMKILKKAAEAKETLRQTTHAALREACIAGDAGLVRNLINELGGDVSTVLNIQPNGLNTLLFIACELGKKDIVKILLDYGADGRIHQITKHSPLHIATVKGKKDIVELLLKRFPELVQQCTVEKWLPLHAACINGHINIMEALLKFSYPQNIMTTFKQGDWEYELPFDVNFKDVTGQTPIYLACLLGNVKMVETMLRFKVKSTRIKVEDEKEKEEKSFGTRRRIADGIQVLMTRLSLGSRNETNERMLSPWHLDLLCNTEQETALHVAVRNMNVEITSLLLSSGANPNLISQNDCVCLVEACKSRNIALVDLLLRYNAHDHESKALSVAIQNKDDLLTAKLLAIRAHSDPEYLINKRAMSEAVTKGLTFTSLLANTPVMINWHGGSAQVPYIRYQWLVSAALHVNPKLKLNPKSQDIVLYAITRLDVSNNSLVWIPPVVFQLQSLKVLNIAQNKIERLPTSEDFDDTTKSKLHSSNKGYSAPVLEELYLQDNRLDFLPGEIFSLPSLAILDCSNNKLSNLPHQMWKSPKLRELNAAFNLLKELPSLQLEDMSESASICSFESSKSADTDLSTPMDMPFALNYPDQDLYLQQYELQHNNLWSKNVEVTEHCVTNDEEADSQYCQIQTLNLAHNQFASVPPILACLAVNLTRLNLSYNRLRTMSHITSYPSTIKQLELSGNQICCWMSLPQIDCLDPMEQAVITCYAPNQTNKPNKMVTGRPRSFRSTILNCVCSHRRHLRLDNLRTLILADNAIQRIQLTTDDDGLSSTDSEDHDSEWDLLGSATSSKSKLMFPALSMLDLSNNNLKEIPPIIHELGSLSVLNVSGNAEINDLPPQMGLLSRLWNLNVKGCNLQEPLKSMIDSKKYKTMDIIGYLKSVLEDAKPYARMKLMIVGVQGIGKTSLLEQLRSEGHKKKPVEHWAKRMGNKSINIKNSKGTNLSTVGVDIGDWTYEKKIRGQSSYGPVTFRTWDFGGQREYYATHQYFLSKRSLYLVVWKIPDGQKGISEILQWLVNIQARAPNSPVLIVGTHYDMMQENYPLSRAEDLQQLIRDRFINVVDAEKCGLPRVIDTIEVSCKTRHNIRILCNLIYDTVFSLRTAGSKTLLLQQCVPASYLILEDVIAQIVSERRQMKQDPVLTSEQYRSIVASYHTNLRDTSELHQATLFLHENGVLLHYEDSTLKDLYFLDPQWLCDMLAHVVTIREINPFARNGVMRLDDLKHVFKSSNLGDVDTKGYIVHLLNKFEVALTWDNRTLLIPSLLPTEDDIYTPSVRVKIPVRSRAWAVRNKKANLNTYANLNNSEESQRENELTSRNDPDVAIRRLLLLSYVPSGFWSRIITRLLADDIIIQIVREFFVVPKEVSQDVRLAKLLDVRAEWSLWQTGMELRYAHTVLFSMKEIIHTNNNPIDYQSLRLQLKQEGSWTDVNFQNVSLLELYLPLDTLVIKQPVMEQGSDSVIGYQAIVLEPSPQKAAHLLALATDHIDILLEDWYPTLGTRFVHTSEGKLLVTRIVPCPTCISNVGQNNLDNQKHANSPEEGIVIRVSNESSDRDSGVADSPSSSRVASEEGLTIPTPMKNFQYSWMVEECILAAIEKKNIRCPVHGEISLAHVAPDTLFLDVGEANLINSSTVSRGKLLGRGAFGFVFQGTCMLKTTGTKLSVAIKAIQPVPPPSGASNSAVIAYKNAQVKWERDPIQHASKAYSTARQELGILLTVRHPNIVPLIGICLDPLCLILGLAPQGALHTSLRSFRRCAATLHPITVQGIILQVAKALEYLHQQHIIYRDLKSENVLVWALPAPFQDHSEVPAHIKLADYGISRLTLPSGTKGFGGTEGFMAPEIMKYNGEEEYTEKVDCFSFGMFIYELVTLHQPFENHESVKECILEGGRPNLTQRETHWPSCILDLMVLCWSHQPCDRPTASQIVSISSAPEFTHLYDVISLNHSSSILTTASNQIFNNSEYNCHSVWLGCTNSKIYQLLSSDQNWLQYSELAPLSVHTPRRGNQNAIATPTALCIVKDNIWIGDDASHIHAYSVHEMKLVWWYSMVEGDDKSPVLRLLWLEPLGRVAVALSCGRIFLVTDSSPKMSCMAEGSFVLTELGSASLLHDMTAVFSLNHKICELWCGEGNGAISVYTLEESVVTNCENLNHYDPLIANVDVVQLVSCSEEHQKFVWTYVYPGCVVYQWDVAAKAILHKLDCSKLVPCSESLKSISIDEHLSPGRCQVTSLCVVNKELYIGTTWGCMVVAETWSLRPITVFRPYEGELNAIVALPASKPPTIATFGRGYRSLITRYKEVPGNIDIQHTYPILWSTDDWVPV